jgi:hypothetical protein
VDHFVSFESIGTEHYHHRNQCLETTLPIAPSMTSNGVFFGSIDDIGSRMSSDRYGCIAAVGHSGFVHGPDGSVVCFLNMAFWQIELRQFQQPS